MSDSCSNCGLNFSEFDVGDGPAYISGFLICFLVPILAVLTEVIFEPSLLTHSILWVFATFLFSYLILIFSRSSFIHLEYKMIKCKDKAEKRKS